MSRGQILFVDDEPKLCEAAAEWLGVSGFTVETFTEPARALARLPQADFDCVVTDVRMPGMDGLAVLAQITQFNAELPVVLLTGHGDVPMAVEAMRSGAHDFLEKPYDADYLVAILDRAVEQRRLKRELRALRNAIGSEPMLERRLVGISAPIAALRKQVEQLADIDIDVLITGETGAGKEVVARALHDTGRRSRGNFVAINCAAIPEALFESEIFGHERGAFSGAAQTRIGKFEFANGGTVFLDEIESMPLALQAKVLRAIQERVIERLGSNRQVGIDVRFIAATKTDLSGDSAAGRFRADLFYRLSTVELTVPPLRERREDVPLLFQLFVADAARRFGIPAPTIRQSDTDRLQARPWPGNVRELKAIADRAALGIGKNARNEGTETSSLSVRVARFEAEVIAEALRDSGGITTDAADRLGLPRRTLNEKIMRYGLRDTGV
ncbi:sigma-54 dependent transcriptional regulator [Devosia neptuniae]|jgi:two-component system C4-dicarboxylate transport response regulator DctD|uniref:sigma-54-dependent transcriptional regulator n=1 Tax=Devosia TaxID=46913 RepID=UPI0022B046FD|nr:sigma-54 dependent transcriptional regulator [Devosia neptuniae]MCZ4348132.1 sigma-54 dependent transcriptional regulator [Devosia neptuniae]|tara:strand:- start:12415 stop:13740 length:1326 start_codon:yes stop_codon:yes gene_type:complete